MLRNVINGQCVNEIYKAGEDLVRGMVVAKDYSAGDANKADDAGVEVYFVDVDYVPTGAYSDVELSEYETDAQAVKSGKYFNCKKLVGGTWATDQVVPTGLSAGDYLIAGTSGDAGKLIKAVATKVSTMRYVGTYDDAGNTLYAFEIVAPHTV